jgi:hypothetical protein
MFGNWLNGIKTKKKYQILVGTSALGWVIRLGCNEVVLTKLQLILLRGLLSEVPIGLGFGP